jgi:hypothetical protein
METTTKIDDQETSDLFADFDEFQTKPRPKSLADRFQDFHQTHPAVYRELVKLAREWMSAGHNRLGIATLFEKLRWEWHVKGVEDVDGYKLNNSYRALYARKIMAENPDLKDIFEIRNYGSTSKNGNK